MSDDVTSDCDCRAAILDNGRCDGCGRQVIPSGTHPRDRTPQQWLEWGEDLIATHSRLQVAETLADMGEQVWRFYGALAEIQDADPVDMALDPNWAARIARGALPDTPALPEER